MVPDLQARQSEEAPALPATPAPLAPLRLNADPVDWARTPKPVAIKLRRLRRERDDAWLVSRSVSDERQEVWNLKHAVEARLQTLTGARHDSQWFTPYAYGSDRLADDHPAVAAELHSLEGAKSEIARLDTIVAARAGVAGQHSRLVEAIEYYFEVGLQRAKTITLYAGPSPSLQKRETPSSAVERCRRRKRELDADLHRAACAPWSSADAKRRLRDEIERRAERGQPNVLPLIESQRGSIGWNGATINDVLVAGRLISTAGDPPAMPLLFWLLRDRLIERMEAEVDAVSDDANALTAAQRSEQIEEIERDRLAVERDEEHWVSVAIDDGLKMLRRPDADPRAVLGLGDDMPAPPT